jgi:indolepyruvate ferredoxin oxidoreductase alpha subunit
MIENVLLSGNEAIARGAYEAGVKVGVGYPGTPSTEIIENFTKYDDVVTEWSVNEKVAMEVGLGSALAGKRTLITMKHVGLNVAADPIFTASYIGANAGMVVVVADDPDLHSSQNEQDSRHYARAAKVAMIEPSDSQEAKDFVRIACELSEGFDTPIFLRTVTRISHSKTIVSLDKKLEYKHDKGFEKENIRKHVMVPAFARQRHFVVEDRMQALEEFSNRIEINRIDKGNGKIAIITSGLCYNYVKDVLPEADVFKIGMIYPLPFRKLIEFCKGYSKVYVVEELDPFIEDQLKAKGVTNLVGKEIMPITGEYSPELIYTAITGNKFTKEITIDITPFPRPPMLCPGCPHAQTFNVLNKLGLTVSGDIGCYTLGALPPYSAMHACVDMGASLPVAQGIEIAQGSEFKNDIVAVIGDSTFAHSGITGLINAAYNKRNTLVIILDNSTTAMTGMQPNPCNGFNIRGEETVVINYQKLAEAIGIKKDNFREVTAYKEADISATVQELLAKKELCVMVVTGACLIYKRKKEKVEGNDKCQNSNGK